MNDSERPVRALIFDFDGLILDTETAVYEAWRELYLDHGHSLTIETWAQCVGSDFGHYDPAADLEAMLERKLDWEPLTIRRRQRVMQMLAEKDAMPGVRELLQQASELSVPCAVASSSPREWVAGWLEKLNLMPFFHHVTTLDDVGRAKPDPGLFLHASEKLGVAPADILVFEDSLNGLRAATAAGMRCMVVPCAITQHLVFDGAWGKLEALSGYSLPLSS